jgi:hypothetical protein
MVGEPLSHLRCSARRPPPVVGLERPPGPVLVALSAAAREAAASAATLALLEAGPRACDRLLATLAEHEQRAGVAAREVRSGRARGIDRAVLVELATALDDIPRPIHQAGHGPVAPHPVTPTSKAPWEPCAMPRASWPPRSPRFPTDPPRRRSSGCTVAPAKAAAWHVGPARRHSKCDGTRACVAAACLSGDGAFPGVDDL